MLERPDHREFKFEAPRHARVEPEKLRTDLEGVDFAGFFVAYLVHRCDGAASEFGEDFKGSKRFWAGPGNGTHGVQTSFVLIGTWAIIDQRKRG